MEHSASPGLGAMIGDNPLLIIVLVFAIGGWLVFRMARSPGPPADADSQPIEPPPKFG